MLLHRFAWKGLQKNSHVGLDAGMHWATTLIKGARGIRCDVTTCRRMAVFFFEELGIPIVSYPDAPCMVYLPTCG